MQDLENYYNEKIKSFYDRSFDQLKTRDIKLLKSSLRFFAWKRKKARDQLIIAIKESKAFILLRSIASFILDTFLRSSRK